MHYRTHGLAGRHAVAIAMAMALVATAEAALAQATVTWNTGTSSVTSNWSSGALPGPNDTVVLSSGFSHLVLNSALSVKAVNWGTVNANGSLTFGNGGSLTIDSGLGTSGSTGSAKTVYVTQTNSAATLINAASFGSRGLFINSNTSTETAYLTIQSGLTYAASQGPTTNSFVSVATTADRNGTLTVSGSLTGANNITLGASTASSGTATFIIDGGSVTGNNFIARDAYGTASFQFKSGTYSNGNAAVQFLSNNTSSTLDIALGSSGSRVVDTGNSLITVMPTARFVDLSAAGSLTKNGTGTLVLQGTSTYTGDTVINSGTLRVENAAGQTLSITTGSASTSVTVSSTAGLFVGQVVSGGNIAANSFITAIGASTITLNQKTAASAGSSVTGTFGAAYGALQGTTLDYNNYGGVLSFGQSTALSLGGLKGSQNLALQNAANAAVALTLGGNNQSTTYSGVLSGSGSLTKAGTGVLTLSGANTFSGGLTVADGSLAIGSINNAGSNGVLGSGVSAVVLGSSGKRGTLSYTGASASSSRAFSAATGGTAAFEVTNSASTLTLSGLISGDGDKTFGGPGSFIVSGSIAGTGGVFKTGAGSLTLSGSGHAGSFTIQEGRLNINAANALGTSSGSLSLAGGVSLDNTSGSLVTIGNAKPIGLGASLNFLGSNSLSMGSGAVTLSGNAAIDVAANTLTFGGDVVGTGYGITKTGTGTLVLGGLSGSNSYTGNTRIEGGRLQLTGLSVMGGGSSTIVTIDQGAYLEVGPTAGVGNVTINTWTGGLITSGTINSSVKYTTSGTLGTSDSLVNGVQTIGSGAVISSSSDLFGTNPNAPVAGRIVMENNSRLRATTGFTMSANKGIQLNSGTAIFESASGQLVLPNVISGAGGLVKTGTGAMTLSGNNSYAGTTTVEAGTLVVNGSLGAGNLTVQSGATLKGNGTINGFTTIDGVHSPGNSPGLETFTNGLSYGSASVLVWELSANTALASDRGSLYDGIDLTGGALSIASGATLNLVFNAALSNGGGLSTVDWDDPFWASSQTWKVIDVQSGAWTPGVFTLGSIGADASGQAFTSSIRSGATFSVSQGNDGSIYVNYVIVPEPDTVIFAGIGIAIAGWSLWKRRRTI